MEICKRANTVTHEKIAKIGNTKDLVIQRHTGKFTQTNSKYKVNMQELKQSIFKQAVN